MRGRRAEIGPTETLLDGQARAWLPVTVLAEEPPSGGSAHKFV